MLPSKRKNKLIPIVDGTFKVLRRTGYNAYKVDFLEEYGVSVTFKGRDLSSYLEDEGLSDLKPNLHQSQVNDAGLSELWNSIIKPHQLIKPIH